jgi:hypothetical protein
MELTAASRAIAMLLLLAGASCRPSAAAEPQTLRLQAAVGDPGDLVYIPFQVPAGIARMEVMYLEGTPQSIGLGVFDPRGKDFFGLGFRGIAGAERRSFALAGNQATLGFVAGGLPAGEWNVVIPNYGASGVAKLGVRLYSGESAPPPVLEPVPEQVMAKAGWYRGDLHVHTEHSSDAWSSGAALSPAAMATRAKDRGLDFIALTDHNVSTQNDALQSAQPEDFLLLAGGEVTTWRAGPGHMIVAGLQSGEFFDWRFRPVHGFFAEPVRSWTAPERPIQPALDYAQARDIYTSAAHPFVAPGFGSNWGFFGDSDQDPAALPDALEVWNNDFFISGGTAALERWDTELRRGRRLCGNGGSDVHGVGGDTEVGLPTTVVFATELSRAAVVAALQACRAYITSAPDGPALLLTGVGPHGRSVMMGDTLIGGAEDRARISARVIGGKGAWLIVTQGGKLQLAREVDQDDGTYSTVIRLDGPGAVRAELWPAPVAAPLGLGPLALSNPIFYGPMPPLPLRAPLTDAYRQTALESFPGRP